LTSHITKSIDTLGRGVLVLVNDNVAAGAQLDAGDLKRQILNLGRTADSPQELVNLELGAVVVNQLDEAVLALAVANKLDLLETSVVTVHVDTSSLVPIGHSLLDHGIEFAQEVFTTDEHVGLHIDGIHNTSQLDGNVAGADNGNLGWEVLHLEEAIASDTVLGTGYLGQVGTTTGSDQNVGGSVAGNAAILLGDLNDLGFGEVGAAVDEVNAFLAPVALVGAIQALDHGIAGLLKLVVVDLDSLGDFVAVVLADVYRLLNGRKVPGHLLGNTSGIPVSAELDFWPAQAATIVCQLLTQH